MKVDDRKNKLKKRGREAEEREEKLRKENM